MSISTKLGHIPKHIKKLWFWFWANRARNGIVLFYLGIILKRTTVWKMTGCHIGKNVSIGLDVYYDVDHAKLIFIEDDVWVGSRCLLLCHRRDMKEYYAGERYKNLPYILKPVILKKGCCVSMGAMIMPGVTVGEGAVVGAGSIVTRDVPAWSVVAGSPAKVIYMIPERK